MKPTCSICNTNFILTEGGDVIDDTKDLYAKWSDCYKCSLEVKTSCEAILKTLPKKEKKEEPNIEDFKKRFDTNNNKPKNIRRNVNK